VDRRYGRRAVTDRKGDALWTAATAVAGGEHARLVSTVQGGLGSFQTGELQPPGRLARSPDQFTRWTRGGRRFSAWLR
jgi:hypothetical protein